MHPTRPDSDTLHRFLLEHSNVRGELVRLDSTWQALLGRSRYPAPVRAVLGEALAAAALLAATVRFDGSLILQISGHGPLHLLVVQATPGGGLRGLARWRGEVPEGPLARLTGSARLAITIDPGRGAQRYQGIVEVAGESLAEVLHEYFARSEQIPTRLWLAADRRRASGLLLQYLPGQSEDRDAWERSLHLTGTLTRGELLELGVRQMLHRLYHQEDVRLFGGERMYFSCDCSRERVAATLVAMGYAELRGIVEEQGAVSVQCEFCNAGYRFDAVDVEQLFAASEQPPVGSTRH